MASSRQATSIGSSSTIDVANLSRVTTPTTHSLNPSSRPPLFAESDVEVLQDRPHDTRWKSRKPTLPQIATDTTPTLRSIWAPKKEDIVPFVPLSRVSSLVDSYTPSVQDSYVPTPRDSPMSFLDPQDFGSMRPYSGLQQDRRQTYHSDGSLRTSPVSGMGIGAGVGGAGALSVGIAASSRTSTGLEIRDGDWLCHACGYHNFRKNDECLK
jgi:hypothetical protein